MQQHVIDDVINLDEYHLVDSNLNNPLSIML